ncbi:MAG: menaquinone-dependent protoporphyrinogen IX dehydrogenase [Candidatus Gracilibacteria bacterium]|nr:menaquinone-dependent protoporphyrinogen IX dehydrogenase [Candidatus Gracilibacteria bacterium]
MTKVLILYSSIDGHTKKIVETIKENLDSKNIISLSTINNAPENIENFDKILIASSIRYGKILPVARKFVQENHQILNTKKTAFVNINLTARKTGKDTPETNAYTKKFLLKTPLKPKLTGVFAGKLDYSLYGPLDTLMIKLIMKITGGPTKTPEPIEYTNWEKVKEFARDFDTL